MPLLPAIVAATAVTVGLATLGALLVVGGILVSIAHWRAWDPAWARAGRHALAEAGWRVSATWDDLVDWLRLGR